MATKNRTPAQAQHKIRQVASEAMVDVAQAAIEGVVVSLGREISDWASRVASQTGRLDDPAYTQKLLYNLGKMAQTSMKASYAQLVTSKEGPGSLTHYRAGQGRFAGGMLREALGSQEFFTVTDNKLLWGNKEFLNSKAAQWHRIAFGAGARGHGVNTQYEVNFEGMLHAVIGISEGPSPGFAMPFGWWDPVNRPRGQSMFTPTAGSSQTEGQLSLGLGHSSRIREGAETSARNVASVPTRGIETKDFFSAGLRRMARELPALLTGYQQDIFGRFAKAAHARLTRVVRITPKVRPSWRE